MTHAERAHAYARDVINGVVPACKWVRLACARHFADLKAGVYRFDEDKAGRACRLIELMPHTKGKWAIKRELIRLENFQCFIVCSIFGWIRPDGTRRYRKAYLCVPRKNAKSTLASGIGNYMFVGDGEFGAEVYSGATTEKQAFEVFRPAKLMLDRSPVIRDAFGVFCGAKGMSREEDGSRFEVVIGKPGDGASPSCGIVDEYHEHAADTLVDTFVTGMGAREQPILLIITTAGSDLAGPCHLFQEDVERILEGTTADEETFGIIYTIDEKPYTLKGIDYPADDWTSEASLRKANPNYGVSVFEPFLKAQQAAAIRNSAKTNTFKTKHLNIWVNAAVAWMNMLKWNAQADAPPEETLLGSPCFGAADLASKIDIAARVRIFKKTVNGVMHYYVYCTSYLPEERAEADDCQHYQKWVGDGHLHTTPGAAIDYETVEKETIAEIKKYRIREFAFDPNNAIQFSQNVDKATPGCTMIEVPQQNRPKMSEGMKELEALVEDGRLHHTGDPVLTWAISNVIAKPIGNDNIFPLKPRPELKIDPAIALIMALTRAAVGSGRGSVYEERGIRSL